MTQHAVTPAPKPRTSLHRRHPHEIRADLLAANPHAKVTDAWDDALVGIVYRRGVDPVALYDREEVIALLIAAGKTRQEAETTLSLRTDALWPGTGHAALLIR